jgi:hypothetical protein
VNRRKRFGILNAIKKASAVALAPKRSAITMSRTKPRIRESKVAKLTDPAALIILPLASTS